MDITAALARPWAPSCPASPPLDRSVTQEPRAVPVPRPERPVPVVVEEWQTKPVPVLAWRHLGAGPVVLRVCGVDVLVYPGAWVEVDAAGEPVAAWTDAAWRARCELRGGGL